MRKKLRPFVLVASVLVLLILPLDGCVTIESEKVPISFPDTELGIEVEPQEPETGEEVEPAVMAEVSGHQPINKVTMLSSFGYLWHRRASETKWELLSVTFDVKSFLARPVHFDKAIIEIAGQVEEADIDIILEPKVRHIEEVAVKTIKGVPTGNHTLRISLESGGVLICEREDIAVVCWKPKEKASKVYVAD